MTIPSAQPTSPINKVQRFEDFFRDFEDIPGIKKYHDKIKAMHAKGEHSLNVLYEDLLIFDPVIADMLRDDPEDLLEDAVEALKNLLKFEYGGSLPHNDYFVRFSTQDDQSPLVVPIRSLRAKNIDKFVWVAGITIRSSAIRPKLEKATFECNVCQTRFEVIQLTSKIRWPKFCVKKNCKGKAQSDFRLISKESEFIDWQTITIQEVPEDLPSGRIPRSVQAILTHDLVDYVKPGDRIKLMGIYKSVIASSINSQNSTLFKAFLEVNYIDPEDKTDDITDITKEDKEKIEMLAKDPNIQKKISRSIAPNIFGREQLKTACALSLFAGTRRKKPGGNYKRGDIHVLFVGDPGTGKSEVIRSAVDVSPRGLYTSGKGSSAVGLTAAVIKDSETGQMNLEAGAIVLANGGVAAIDEFDKMDSGDRSALHEGMEQQSYHYNTEIITTNGKRIIIGEFVDKLMETHKNEVIEGINCQILPYNNLKLFTTDFEKIYKTRIDRISRHKSPEKFYKFKFTNGRSITVTPEHPIFVHREILKCIPASDCQIDDFIPIPRYLPNSSKPITLSKNQHTPHSLSKSVQFPNEIDDRLSKIMGFLVSEGHSYKGSSAEIGFSNKESSLLNEFNQLFHKVFNIVPTISEKEDGTITLRYISVELYSWMLENFNEIMTKSKFKRIPSKILGASSRIIKSFLIGAFKGDGSVESTSVCYRTASKGLSFDYQDALLKIGILSRIVSDSYNDSYKVYIRGQSLIPFFHKIIEENDHRYEKIKNLIGPDQIKTHHHDIFPTAVIKKILLMKKDLALVNDGYFYKHLKSNHGITRNKLIEELDKLKNKIELIKKILSKKVTITEIRTLLGYSQEDLARISKLKRGNIDYYERGGYNDQRRKKIELKILNSLKENLNINEQSIENLEKLINAEILWDTIKDIEIIDNQHEEYTPWVYDITVEPTHTFISQGVVLHNTVSIAKAGIVATLKSQTAIIAAANPHFGRYDTNKSAPQNIRMPPSLLSRFDLIFVVIDVPDRSMDAQMAEHILQSAMIGVDDDVNEKEDLIAPISPELLKKYIKHAKKTCFPTLSEEAKERIKDYYLELRDQSNSEEAIVSILARNLDALVRLGEAHAKMALRDKVLKEDVESIILLFDRYLRDTGLDPSTGKIDMTRLFAGDSKNNLSKLDQFLTRLKEIFEENNYQSLDRKAVIQILELEESFDRAYIKNALDEFLKEGTLYEPKSGQIKFTNRRD